MIITFTKHFYVIKCDSCGQCSACVEENKSLGIYNGAQAARSFGWQFGRDKKVLCPECKKEKQIKRGFLPPA